MNFAKIVKQECCTIDFNAENKEQALKNIVKLFQNNRELAKIDENLLFEKLNEREQKGTTGFGDQIAMPHCQLPELNQFYIAVAISKKGVNFDSFDKKKVKIFVSIIGPSTEQVTHLKLLAKVSHILKEEKNRIDLLDAASHKNLWLRFMKGTPVENVQLSPELRQKLMFLTVKDEKIMDYISEVFIEHGIDDATIVHADQMDDIVSKTPLFLGFFNFTKEKSTFSELIITKIDEELLPSIVKSIEDRFGNLDTYAGLSIVVLDIFFSKG